MKHVPASVRFSRAGECGSEDDYVRFTEISSSNCFRFFKIQSAETRTAPF